MVITEQHIVPENTKRTRLYNYACSNFKTINTNKGIKKAIAKGLFYINGETAQSGTWIEPGQKIELLEQDKTPAVIYRKKLDVLFEDEFIAIINKPAGIVVNGNYFRTVENALLHNICISSEKDALKMPQAVHRLDYATSGLLLIAKTKQARIRLGKQFENRNIKKIYKAVVIGKINHSGKIDIPVNNQTAYTEYKLIKHIRSLTNHWLSFVELFPYTGRKHQLRKHLAATGFPVMGDKLYQNKGQMIKGKGMFLCATALSFLHPETKKQMNIEINEPKKFETFLQREQNRWNKFNM